MADKRRLAPDALLAEKVAQAVALLSETCSDAWLTFTQEMGEGGDPTYPFLMGERDLGNGFLLLTRAGERIEAPGHLQVAVAQLLHLEVEPAHLQHQVVEEVDGESVEVRLPREGRDQGVGVPEELLDRAQEAPRGLEHPPHEAAARAVERFLVEGEVQAVVKPGQQPSAGL